MRSTPGRNATYDDDNDDDDNGSDGYDDTTTTNEPVESSELTEVSLSFSGQTVRSAGVLAARSSAGYAAEPPTALLSVPLCSARVSYARTAVHVRLGTYYYLRIERACSQYRHSLPLYVGDT